MYEAKGKFPYCVWTLNKTIALFILFHKCLAQCCSLFSSSASHNWIILHSAGRQTGRAEVEIRTQWVNPVILWLVSQLVLWPSHYQHGGLHKVSDCLPSMTSSPNDWQRLELNQLWHSHHSPQPQSEEAIVCPLSCCSLTPLCPWPSPPTHTTNIQWPPLPLCFLLFYCTVFREEFSLSYSVRCLSGLSWIIIRCGVVHSLGPRTTAYSSSKINPRNPSQKQQKKHARAHRHTRLRSNCIMFVAEDVGSVSATSTHTCHYLQYENTVCLPQMWLICYKDAHFSQFCYQLTEPH